LENCSFLGTDNVCEQISKHISMPVEDYCLQVCISHLNVFFLNLTCLAHCMKCLFGIESAEFLSTYKELLKMLLAMLE